MKLIILGLFLLFTINAFSQTAQMPKNSGLVPAYITDVYGNGIFDSINKTLVNTGASIMTTATGYKELTSRMTTLNKTFYLNHYYVEAFLNSASTTDQVLGTCSLQIPRGTSVFTANVKNPTHGAIDRVIVSFNIPFFVASGTSVVSSCLPTSGQSTIFNSYIGGYEF